LLDDGDRIERKKSGFRLEPAWLTQPDFKDKMIERWPDINIEEVQDFWKKLKKGVRQLSKGMGANMDGQMRRDKARLMHEIKDLDVKADGQGLDNSEWKRRYSLERHLEEIYPYEEKIGKKGAVKDGFRWGMQIHASSIG
jgi:hypothetical protein